MKRNHTLNILTANVFLKIKSSYIKQSCGSEIKHFLVGKVKYTLNKSFAKHIGQNTQIQNISITT